MTDFPDMVYRVPGLHREQNGHTFDFLGVNDADELAAALADGWHLTIGDAVAATSAPSTDELIADLAEATDAVDDVSPATRDELEQKARELGIGFNARTTDATLALRIAEKL